jgi:hypothetical protein
MTAAAEKPKRKAAPSKPEAAAAEVTDTPRAITFRGVEITLPRELPPTLLFDVAEMEANDGSPMPVFRLLRSLLGAEQFTAVRNQLTDKDDVVDIVNELLVDLFAQYGITLGESSASGDS